MFADLHVHLEALGEPVGAMLDTIADCGVTHTALQVLTKYGICENLSALYWKTHYDRMRVYAFGGLHQFDCFGDIPYEKQAEELLSLGVDGMKFLDMKPDYRKRLGKEICDQSYDRMFSMLEERQVPVLLHSGDPETFWDPDWVSDYHKKVGWFYGDGSFLTSAEIYGEVFAMLDKHPKLPLTLAHFFFLSNKPGEAVRVMETYPNVRFDLTPGGEMYLGFSKDIDFWHDFFVQYQDRILFGTDSNAKKAINASLNTFVRQALTHDRSEFTGNCYGSMTIRGLDLPADVVEKITYGKFAAFAGAEPKPVSADAFRCAAERVYDRICDDPAHTEDVVWLRSVLDDKK
ncbi:MAG: amidohydrolase family protein [Clostridia bacterium]|nr:amidohydrolase family protein [Clostridia bacterium]